jgi:hypothetical protein
MHTNVRVWRHSISTFRRVSYNTWWWRTCIVQVDHVLSLHENSEILATCHVRRHTDDLKLEREAHHAKPRRVKSAAGVYARQQRACVRECAAAAVQHRSHGHGNRFSHHSHKSREMGTTHTCNGTCLLLELLSFHCSSAH